MKCKQAVVIIGYYVGGMIREYKEAVSKPDVYTNTQKMIVDGGFDVEILNTFMEMGSNWDSLYKLDTLKSIGEYVLNIGHLVEDTNTDCDYKDCWFDGGEDVGFYLIEIGQSIVAGVELLNTLELTVEELKCYVADFVQSF